MKKILIGILLAFLTLESCFAEFMINHHGETFTGYIMNCMSQTIEKVTLPYGTCLDRLGVFFYVEGDLVYEVHTHPDSWHKDKVTGKNITMWDRYSFDEKSMKEAIIYYIKGVENFQKWDLSDLLEKVENMKFEDD